MYVAVYQLIVYSSLLHVNYNTLTIYYAYSYIIVLIIVLVQLALVIIYRLMCIMHALLSQCTHMQRII